MFFLVVLILYCFVLLINLLNWDIVIECYVIYNIVVVEEKNGINYI